MDFLGLAAQDGIHKGEALAGERPAQKAGVEADIYLMAVGATVEGQGKTSKQVADLAMKNGYKFSPRLHVDLFGNKWGT